jgi:hypothetical protein
MDVELALQWRQRGEIRVTVRDPMNAVKRVSVGYRWAPSRDYTISTTDPAGTKQVEVPANADTPARLEYFVRGLDAKDGAVFEEGTPELPKNAEVREPARAGAAEKGSFFTSPVFLAAGGVILVAAGVASYFVLRPTTYNPSSSAHSVIGASCGATRCD